MAVKQVRWRMNKAEGFVALNPDQFQSLGMQFGLSREDLSVLSFALGRALDPKVRSRTLFIDEIGKEGKAAFTSAMRSIEQAVKHLKSARKQLRLLDISTPVGPDTYISPYQDLFAALMESAALAELARRRFQKAVVHGMPLQTRERASDRHRGDARRRVVCLAIIRFWDSIGRQVSYTTDPIGSQRKGQLVEFINAVVGCVTEPRASLGGETIAREITSARIVIQRDRDFEQKKCHDAQE